MEALLAILGVAGAIVLVVTIVNILMTFTQSRISLKQYKPKGKTPEHTVRRIDYVRQWAKENDFEFLEYYWVKVGFQKIFMAVWRRTDRPTFLCTYLMNVTDIVTEFAGDISLTTANSRAAQYAPKPPENYSQTFSRVTLDEQWRRHLEMENFLMDAGGAELVYAEIQFEEYFIGSVRKSLRYVRSIPYWYLLGAYWYFVRQNLWHNKSIKTQCEKGMIKLPNEIPKDYPTVE